MIGDRYLLEERIGVGATSEVWLAGDRLLERQVAVKRLLPGLASDDAARERFLRGAAAAARLRHPGIVPVYDAGEDDDGPWIVMELIRGRTLADLLAERQRLPAAEVAGIVAEVAAALDHAHALGVVHRDVKPANLVRGDDGRVRITDFGLARPVEGATITLTGEMVGTAAYLAPEVVGGEPASPASDIYSLGAVAYELVSGRRPFTAESTIALLEAIRDDEPAPLRGVAPPEMATAIATAMAKHPEDRSRTAGEFATALTETATAVLPPPRSPTPTQVLAVPPPAAAAEEAPASTPSYLLAVAGLGLIILLAILVWAAFDGSDGEGAALTDPVAAVTTSLPLPTTAITTAASSSTTTIPTTTVLSPENPETIVVAIHHLLDSMQPPQFRPPEVREVRRALDKTMEAWEEEEMERVADRLEEVIEKVDQLPNSEEREELTELVLLLAESMGFRVEEDD